VLWEHLVLDTLIAAGAPKIHFWRDKQQREVDFVVPHGRDAVDAIECKWKPEAFETRGLAAFREQYPKGKNYVVSPLNGPSYERVQGGLKIQLFHRENCVKRWPDRVGELRSYLKNLHPTCNPTGKFWIL
jgi:predicted AAA+ superfamily ATPase